MDHGKRIRAGFALCHPGGQPSAVGGDVSLRPGEHQISVRQSGYMDFTQKVVLEPGKKVVLHVTMQKDPRAQFPTVTSQLKLQVTPERAAVFLDDGFVGTVREFSGVGRGMLVSPGKHRVKICYPARELRSRRT
ncbi:MAG: hypothetical protein DMG72_25345 [Acidobacteria bacterium]|nr:MAG: hypothetical protein DMG72_25345 [Acidobacteriota bacterium]